MSLTLSPERGRRVAAIHVREISQSRLALGFAELTQLQQLDRGERAIEMLEGVDVEREAIEDLTVQSLNDFIELVQVHREQRVSKAAHGIIVRRHGKPSRSTAGSLRSLKSHS